MHTDTEMDDGDGKAPEVDLAREEALLTRKLRLLEDFTKKELPGTLPPLEERLRSLQQAIQSREAVITRAGKTNSARKYLEEASEVTPREEFLAGIISHDDFASFTLVSEQGHPTRIGLADNGLPAPNPSLSSILVPGGFFSEDSPSDASLQGSSRSRPRESINSADKERAPCLRCKILKRKCDSLEKCSLCPQQSYENENDYWKVIGCFRGGLRDLAPLLLPPNTRWTNRSYSFPPGPPQSFQVFLRSKRNFDAVKHYVGHIIDFRLVLNKSPHRPHVRVFRGALEPIANS
ncbi:hypothetical protein BGZ57DRAFT_398161 [Hyaloscypha finlandica]|nr:hypothetical protein BGZ57DRAFT_398161 [Hyaloscypha finlandica]